MTYTITFEQRADNANYGKIVLVATRGGGDDATVNVFIDLIAPDGTSLNTKNFASPDLVVTTPKTKTWSIPLDSDDDYLRGTYTVALYVEQTVSTPGTQTLDEDSEYYFNAYDNLSNLTWNETCVPGAAAILQLVDSGNYTDFTVVSKEIKIVYPPQENKADLTGSGTSLSINPRWSNVDYVGSVRTECFLTTDDGDVDWFEQYSFDAQNTKTFQCSSCDITECVSEFANKIAAKPSLSPADEKLLNLVLLYETAYRNAKACGNTSQASSFVTKIKTLIGCDCGCDESDEPSPITSEALDGLINTTNEPTAWTLITNSDLAGAWDTETYPDHQLMWRQHGEYQVEIIGRLGSTGLLSGLGSAFLSGYFEAEGITLLDHYEFPAQLVANGGAPSIRFGGVFSVAYSGTTDTITLTVSNDVTPSGQAWFSIHAFIPMA